MSEALFDDAEFTSEDSPSGGWTLDGLLHHVIPRVVCAQERIEDGDTAEAYAVLRDLEDDLVIVRERQVTA